jgi:site-specific recombinase XerD
MRSDTGSPRGCFRKGILKSIADVLGHRDLETTLIYTKVDFNALSQVALPWPEEGN